MRYRLHSKETLIYHENVFFSTRLDENEFCPSRRSVFRTDESSGLQGCNYLMTASIGIEKQT